MRRTLSVSLVIKDARAGHHERKMLIGQQSAANCKDTVKNIPRGGDLGVTLTLGLGPACRFGRLNLSEFSGRLEEQPQAAFRKLLETDAAAMRLFFPSFIDGSLIRTCGESTDPGGVVCAASLLANRQIRKYGRHKGDSCPRKGIAGCRHCKASTTRPLNISRSVYLAAQQSVLFRADLVR